MTQFNMTIVALVAVVAIVGLVALVMNAAPTNHVMNPNMVGHALIFDSEASERNRAGQATISGDRTGERVIEDEKEDDNSVSWYLPWWY